MKKIAWFTLFLIFLSCVHCMAYEKEILFRGMTWDTDAVTFRDTLMQEIGKPSPSEAFLDYSLKDYGFFEYFDYDGEYMYKSVRSNEYGGNAYAILVSAADDCVVAGHPITSIHAYAINKVDNGKVLDGPENSRIVSAMYLFDYAAIQDEDFAYRDLLKKLSDIYGKCDLQEARNDGKQAYNVWYGENNTYVMLSAYMEEGKAKTINLQYGLLNTAELLEEIRNPAPIDISGNFDGL